MALTWGGIALQALTKLRPVAAGLVSGFATLCNILAVYAIGQSI